jgi:hypothetical protein
MNCKGIASKPFISLDVTSKDKIVPVINQLLRHEGVWGVDV